MNRAGTRGAPASLGRIIRKVAIPLGHVGLPRAMRTPAQVSEPGAAARRLHRLPPTKSRPLASYLKKSIRRRTREIILFCFCSIPRPFEARGLPSAARFAKVNDDDLFPWRLGRIFRESSARFSGKNARPGFPSLRRRDFRVWARIGHAIDRSISFGFGEILVVVTRAARGRIAEQVRRGSARRLIVCRCYFLGGRFRISETLGFRLGKMSSRVLIAIPLRGSVPDFSVRFGDC